MISIRFICLLLFVLNLNSLSGQDIEMEEKIMFTPVEIMASYPQGRDSLVNFIYSHLRWPDPMFCGEGTVVIKVAIDDCGLPMDYEIMRGIAEVADKEALRVIKLIEKWKPKNYRGVAISSDFYIPVKFKLD